MSDACAIPNGWERVSLVERRDEHARVKGLTRPASSSSFPPGLTFCIRSPPREDFGAREDFGMRFMDAFRM